MRSAPPTIDSWRERFAQRDIGGWSKVHPAGLKMDPGPSSGRASCEAARVSNCSIRRGQAGALAEKTSEEAPQASGNGSEGAASAAPVEQEIELFDRIFRRPVSGQEIFPTEGCALKYLRKAQKSLGQLNDDAQGRSLAASLKRNAAWPPMQFLDRKRERRLIRAAAAAYRKLAARH
jgi:hypothetical protein